MRTFAHAFLHLFALCFLPTALAADMPELTLFQGETRVIAEPNAGRLQGNRTYPS